jgi:hypothetical protein
MAVIALLAMGLAPSRDESGAVSEPVDDYGILGLGAIIMVVSLVPGIAHLLFRIKFRRPYSAAVAITAPF